jgi:hypothetical protein
MRAFVPLYIFGVATTSQRRISVSDFSQDIKGPRMKEASIAVQLVEQDHLIVALRIQVKQCIHVNTLILCASPVVVLYSTVTC